MKIFRSGAYESFYDMPLTVQWYITMKCNYNCSYCVNRKIFRNDLPFSTVAQLKAAVDNIASLNRPWYDIIFVGGEPTIHPHLFDTMAMLHETLRDRLNNIIIITNGSRNTSFYEKIADLAKSTTISMLISIHTEYIDMAHILELIETLSKDVTLTFALMFNPVKREEVHLIYDILFEYRKIFPFSVNIDPIFEADGSFDPHYIEEDFSWRKVAATKFRALNEAVSSKVPIIKRNKHRSRVFYDVEQDGERKILATTDTVSKYQNELQKLTGMYCSANTGVLNIQENGICNGMVCFADPSLFNIYEEDSIKAVREQFIHAVQCPMPICSCNVNDRIPKFSSIEEAQHFIEVVRAKQSALFDAAK